MTIKVLLADDHRVMRHGLRKALARKPQIQVVGEADNGRLAVELAHELKPDVVLMDIDMPDLDGIEATRQIVSSCPGVKVIALSMYSRKPYVMSMLRAGAVGFLLKTCSFDELIEAVLSVVSGRSYLSAEIAGTVIEMAMNPTRKIEAPGLAELTPRERKIVKLLAEGYTNKTIADTLGLSETTIEVHRKQIIKKLNLHSVAEITKFAVRVGLTSLDI